MSTNKLYYGDNLAVMRQHVPSSSVDLVYLDPPFNSDREYNAFFKQQDSTRSAAQIKAFTDTWRWDAAAAASYQTVVEAGGKPAQALKAMRDLLGTTDVLSYLAMMTPRLIELRRTLKDTGSLFLHCDPTASHYLKVILDMVFGPDNFRNEIIWHYNTGGKGKKQFLRKHDTILWYSKSANFHFDREAVALPRSANTAHLRRGVDKDGREYYEDYSPRKSGKQYRWYLDEGVTPMDVWTDIQALNPEARERLGFPTQKPEALLARIIKAACPSGGTVLDPFCGCGTAIIAAQRLKRIWLGIDITYLATNLIKTRLLDIYGVVDYDVIGEPVTADEAATLAKEDPYQFQWWSLGLLGARPPEQRKGADAGVDGKLFFHDDSGGETKQMLFSVKAGKLDLAHVRDLRGVIEREQAQIGVLVTLNPPTPKMRAEAADAGFYKSHWASHPRLQILTVAEILQGVTVDSPPLSQVNVTFKKAPVTKPKPDDQPTLI